MVRALILADGDVPERAELDGAWPGWSAGVDLVIAADGGARHAGPLGVTIDRWVGDGDSLDEQALADLAAAGVPIERARTDKDETDMELAIRAALAAGATDLVIVGALGGARLDHALANIGLLGLPGLRGRTACLLDARTRVSLLEGPAAVDLAGRIGDLVSLLPAGADVEGVTTVGLRYPLADEVLPSGTPRGVSNVVVGSDARVSVRVGRLLIVETPATFAA